MLCQRDIVLTMPLHVCVAMRWLAEHDLSMSMWGCYTTIRLVYSAKSTMISAPCEAGGLYSLARLGSQARSACAGLRDFQQGGSAGGIYRFPPTRGYTIAPPLDSPCEKYPPPKRTLSSIFFKEILISTKICKKCQKPVLYIEDYYRYTGILNKEGIYTFRGQSAREAVTMRTRLQKAQLYVDEAKEALNLTQWEIKVQDYPSADDAYADIEPHDYLWHAKLRLSEDFWKEKPEDQAKIVAHELLHLHYAGVERIINSLESSLGNATHELLSKFWDIEIERAADALSGPVGGLLPTPDFGGK